MGRADKIIAEAAQHGNTFTEDRDGLAEEIGFLCGEIRKLCAELDRYSNQGIKPGANCFLVEVEDSDGATFLAEYEYEPLVHGKLYGPPEHCYPDEGGYVTIIDIWLYGDSYSPETFNPSLIERWQEKIYIQHSENDAAEYEYQREEENERRRGEF